MLNSKSKENNWISKAQFSPGGSTKCCTDCRNHGSSTHSVDSLKMTIRHECVKPMKTNINNTAEKHLKDEKLMNQAQQPTCNNSWNWLELIAAPSHLRNNTFKHIFWISLIFSVAVLSSFCTSFQKPNLQSCGSLLCSYTSELINMSWKMFWPKLDRMCLSSRAN